MALFHWRHGWGTLPDLEAQVDRLLETLRIPFPPLRMERQFPPLNLYELPDSYLITSKIPGVSANELEITVSDGMLQIRGERRGSEGVSEDRFRRQERFRGSFQRSIQLPDRVAQDQLRAEFNDGILKVWLPKVADYKPRQITVASSSD